MPRVSPRDEDEPGYLPGGPIGPPTAGSAVAPIPSAPPMPPPPAPTDALAMGGPMAAPGPMPMDAGAGPLPMDPMGGPMQMQAPAMEAPMPMPAAGPVPLPDVGMPQQFGASALGAPVGGGMGGSGGSSFGPGVQSQAGEMSDDEIIRLIQRATMGGRG